MQPQNGVEQPQRYGVDDAPYDVDDPFDFDDPCDDDAPYDVDIATAAPPLTKRCKCHPCVGCGRVFKGFAGLCAHHRSREDCNVKCLRLLWSYRVQYNERCEEIMLEVGCRCRAGWRGNGKIEGII